MRTSVNNLLLRDLPQLFLESISALDRQEVRVMAEADDDITFSFSLSVLRGPSSKFFLDPPWRLYWSFLKGFEKGKERPERIDGLAPRSSAVSGPELAGADVESTLSEVVEREARFIMWAAMEPRLVGLCCGASRLWLLMMAMAWGLMETEEDEGIMGVEGTDVDD